MSTVRLISPEQAPLAPAPAPDVDPETGSLLSQEDIKTLESFIGDVSGYFYRALDVYKRQDLNRPSSGQSSSSKLCVPYTLSR